MMKFSMRFSILSIVLTLLISVSAFTLIFGYIALNKVLILSASNTLKYASDKAAIQIDNYLKPLAENAAMASNALKNGVINSSDAEPFLKFLYYLILDNPSISSAYFCDTKGNFYLSGKDKNKGFLQKIILVDKEHYQNEGLISQELFVDDKGLIVSQKPVDPKAYLPMERPWYREAIAQNKPVITIYEFIAVGNQQAQLGASYSLPLYNTKGVLIGVFGMDVLIKDIFQYIEGIHITQNSNLFLVANDGAELTSDKNNLGVIRNIYHEIKKRRSQLSQPNQDEFFQFLRRASFDRYREEHKDRFVFSFMGKEYISVYSAIAIFSAAKWSVCIITPVDDINGELRKSISIWFMFILITIFIGAIFTSVFSSCLSLPIKKLAKDSMLICQLRLNEVKETVSRIKEISAMSESFMQMRNAVSSFQRYMPIALVKKLIISDKIAAVGGESKELTLMFTDIQNFTSLSENIDPQELMEYLSSYFQVITRIVIDCNGTVDKYIGDGMMAFWGAPVDDSDHVRHACMAALKIQRALQDFNQACQKANKPVVITRIGINTGNVVVGNVGSDDRLNYTSLGDSVNLANRLENINKVYGTAIIVSEYTYNLARDKFKFRFLDRVLVKGKKKGVYIYELLDYQDAKPDLKLIEYNRDFQIAFMSYENGDWQKALGLFNQLSSVYPDNHVIRIFIERCLRFIEKPPANINGVWVSQE